MVAETIEYDNPRLGISNIAPTALRSLLLWLVVVNWSSCLLLMLEPRRARNTGARAKKGQV